MYPDMTCRGFQFKVGETFRHEGEVIPCHSGFHFCKDIKDIANYYQATCRIFEVEASGVIVEEGDKTVTDTLTIVKEIDYADFADHGFWWVRTVVANRRVCLDKLMYDVKTNVRRIIANQGYRLDLLINDPDSGVRQIIARQGYGLDVLINDPDWQVRYIVAKQGYGLDILINDHNWRVRLSVASQGYGLDKLVNDIDPDVRREIALKGHGLDILINDNDSSVRIVAMRAKGRLKCQKQ